MATKTYVIAANDVASGAKSTSTYVSKVTRASVKAATTTATPVYSKNDFSTKPSTSGSPSTPNSDSSSDSTSNTAAKVGGANGQDAFTTNGSGLKDAVIGERGLDESEDWTRSFSGMAIEPFEKEVAELLMKPLDPDDIEIKPDGIVYLPEIKYRRILNKAFGWGLAPRSEHSVSPKTISREYALICRGRFVSTARGEQDYFDPNQLATATEGCKSNALMRCCKDLGIASELWDPAFIRKFKKQYCDELWVEHAVSKIKKKIWKRKDQADLDYPWVKK
ncbi:hypothetical protein BGX34_001961 [Mortierella sp. NVP85]|nr:hypothetical protein BGX34_001961 [Mortierella sp. NVP85]